MDPVQEEKQALSQQEEFESRLFAEEDYVVIACVPATKAGIVDKHGVLKQYFLVLTVGKNDNGDCKLHQVRVKNNGLDLVIQKGSKIHKLKWFEIATESNGASTMSSWDFKLHWKNGQNDAFALSPNTLRSVQLFAFIVYHVGLFCAEHEISTKPLELVELEVHGREWLDKIFNNNLLFRRITQTQQDIFTPIYKRLASGNIGASSSHAKDVKKGDGKKRRLSMRNDQLMEQLEPGTGNNRAAGMDVPLMSREETENIKYYMDLCGVSIDNIHLLESKLMERQRNMMRENITSFQVNEDRVDRLLGNIDKSITTVTDLRQDLEQYRQKISKMQSGVKQIKNKNHSLAIQDQNNSTLTRKLAEITKQLQLDVKYEQILKNPSFKPDPEYKRSLKAVDNLSSKLNLTFTDGLESMKAVKSQREHFKTLNERFCAEATNFLNDLFTRNSKLKEKYDVPRNKYEKQRFVGPHTPIHAILFKYDELLKHIGLLHADKFKRILTCYERAFSKLYAHEFKAYFSWLNKLIYTEQSDLKMADLPTIKLDGLLRDDDVELSRSTASTIFSNKQKNVESATQLGPGVTRAVSTMPTINETVNDDSKEKVTKVYRQCLAETLPVIIIEQQFMEKFFFDDDMDDADNKAEIERILTAMFSHLEHQILHIIDRADSMNKFNTLEMLIVSERALHCYGDYSMFLAGLLSKLQTKLTLNWNKFVSQEIDWIKSQKIAIKQAGILLSMQKFPAFCNEMYRVVTFGDEKSKEITDIETLIPKDSLAFIEKNVIKKPPRTPDSPQSEYDDDDDEEEAHVSPFQPPTVVKQQTLSLAVDHTHAAAMRTSVVIHVDDLEEAKMSGGGAGGGGGDQVIFRESEQVTNTIHKMTTTLFVWLEKAAQTDRKYTYVCLMENYHYFYSVFNKTHSLRAIREHVSKAKRNYDKARRAYVKWCVRYECEALTDFWDDFEQRVLSDMETVTVYISSQKVRMICTEYLDSDKKIKKFVGGMFSRLKKHLVDNDILFSKIWRKIAEYFCSKYKKFKENVDKIYQQQNLNDNDKYLKYSMEFVWTQFVEQYRNAFQNNYQDDNSSVGSEISAGQSSQKTSNSYYAYNQNRKDKVQAGLKDKQNKTKKALSSFKHKMKRNSSNRSLGGGLG